MAPNILKIAKRHRTEIDRIDAANLRQVTKAYTNMYSALTGDIEALRLAIEAVDAPTVAAIKRLPQYRSLLRRSDEELRRFTNYLETVIGTASTDAIGLGLSHSKELVNMILSGRFGGLKTNVVAPLLDYLRRDGPLYARLQLLTGSTVERVVSKIIEGIGLGRNPRVIASAIQDAFGGGLTDALRNARTVQLYAYRDSARANYTASGVVQGWIWYAELDGQQCEACTAEHGSIHGLDETLEGHYNCRCSALPYIENVSEPIASGEEWFNSLSDKEKADYLGQSKYEALSAGKFEFSQLSTRAHNDVYGDMAAVASLSSLIGETE